MAAVQFSVYADKDNPSDVVEAYTFKFQYLDNPANARHKLISMTLPDACEKLVTVISGETGLQEILDCLWEYDKSLPDLPGECSIDRITVSRLTALSLETFDS